MCEQSLSALTENFGSGGTSAYTEYGRASRRPKAYSKYKHKNLKISEFVYDNKKTHRENLQDCSLSHRLD